jgi:hypothetical protein
MAKGKGTANKATKKRKDPEPEPDEEDPPVEDDQEEPDDEPEADGNEEVDEAEGGEEGEEGEEGGEEDEEDEEEDEERAAKKAAKKAYLERSRNLRNNKSAKSKGYRRLALLSLTGSKKGSVMSHNRTPDAEDTWDTPVVRSATGTRYKNSNSLNAINRMCKFMPENFNQPSYTKSEFELRTSLATESLGREAANVIRANMEPIAHKILTQAILNRWDGGGKPRVGAYDIHLAARALIPCLDVSSSFPIGVIRNAQLTPVPQYVGVKSTVDGKTKTTYKLKDPKRKILDLPEKESEQVETEVAKCKELKKHAKKVLDATMSKKEARKSKKQKTMPASGGEAVAPMVA